MIASRKNTLTPAPAPAPASGGALIDIGARLAFVRVRGRIGEAGRRRGLIIDLGTEKVQDASGNTVGGEPVGQPDDRAASRQCRISSAGRLSRDHVECE